MNARTIRAITYYLLAVTVAFLIHPLLPMLLTFVMLMCFEIVEARLGSKTNGR